jgi:NAD(P)-dependent dehydrogenase (short-subunit alcohol dehydrogenase family)
MTQLTDTRIVILGGTSGIGLATARAAAAAGASLVVASANPERVDAALEQLPAGAEGYAVDLADEHAIRDLFARLGAFDHLVYTAGGPLYIAPLGELDLAEARRAYDVRVWGALAAARYAAPQIRAGGSITLSSGGAAVRPTPGWSVAASICGAVESMTRALALELAPLRVNAVAPGLVRTELWRPLGEEATRGLYASYGTSLPVGRVGEPEDIAETFLYVLRNAYTTGTIVAVDGGGLLV